jgi:NLE (NUC135) domain
MFRRTHLSAGTQLQLPQGTSPAQLQTLLNQLLHNEEALPYAFYIEDLELSGDIGSSMMKNNVSVEQVVHVVYRPQAVFRVRPVARCSATMEGEIQLPKPASSLFAATMAVVCLGIAVHVMSAHPCTHRLP